MNKTKAIDDAMGRFKYEDPRSIQKILASEPQLLEPWEVFALAYEMGFGKKYPSE